MPPIFQRCFLIISHIFFIPANSKGYSSNNYERWAANIAANANMEASNSPALKRISSNPSTSSSALNATTANSNISTGMYYPHHYTGPTSTSSAYSSPYLSRSSRMHHNTISSGGNETSFAMDIQFILILIQPND